MIDLDCRELPDTIQSMVFGYILDMIHLEIASGNHNFDNLLGNRLKKWSKGVLIRFSGGAERKKTVELEFIEVQLEFLKHKMGPYIKADEHIGNLYVLERHIKKTKTIYINKLDMILPWYYAVGDTRRGHSLFRTQEKVLCIDTRHLPNIGIRGGYLRDTDEHWFWVDIYFYNSKRFDKAVKFFNEKRVPYIHR